MAPAGTSNSDITNARDLACPPGTEGTRNERSTLGVLVENKPACSRGSPRCSVGVGSTSGRWRWVPTEDPLISRV